MRVCTRSANGVMCLGDGEGNRFSGGGKRARDATAEASLGARMSLRSVAAAPDVVEFVFDVEVERRSLGVIWS